MTREEIIKKLEEYIPWADPYEVDIEVLKGALELLKNGIPHETVTEFADRCRECGAKYGKLLNQEPKTGHWIDHDKHIECDKCRTWFLKDYLIRKSFCPNCGAKMVEPQEREDKG